MSKMTGALALVNALEREGVDIMFGYPGGFTIAIHDALMDSTVKHVLVRHEQGAAHAADGYARVTGRAGVCLATSGPGATNLVTGIATAHMDSIPMVAITAQVPTHLLGKDAFQETDITGITFQIVKHSYLVKDPGELTQTIREAFFIAQSGRPGPVLIDLPADIIRGKVPEHVPESRMHRSVRLSRNGSRKQVERALELLQSSERPLIYVGGGVIASDAGPELLQLAEKLDAPVVHTLMGKGCFPEEHSLSLGMLGMHGTAAANYAVHHCDLIIAVGARFDDRATGRLDRFAPGAKVIHIDIDPAEIGKNVPAMIPIVGDAKEILGYLVDGLEPCRHREWVNRVRDWKQRHPLTYDHSHEYLLPQFVIQEIHRITKGEAIVITDVGQNQMWASQFYLVNRPRQFITSGGLGTMGFGLPAAIGAQFGRPKDLVFAITGDGGFQMTMQEMMVAVEHRLPIKIALLNNGFLGMVRQWQELFWGKRYAATDISCQPDFVKLAEAFGARAFRIEQPDQVEPGIQNALAVNDGPCLLEFRVAREEKVYPMIPAGGTIDDMILPPRTRTPVVKPV